MQFFFISGSAPLFPGGRNVNTGGVAHGFRMAQEIEIRSTFRLHSIFTHQYNEKWNMNTPVDVVWGAFTTIACIVTIEMSSDDHQLLVCSGLRFHEIYSSENSFLYLINFRWNNFHEIETVRKKNKK